MTTVVVGDYLAFWTRGWNKTVADAASMPDITVTSKSDGSGFDVLIDGDAGLTHQIWYQTIDGTSWTDGGTQVGDGTKSVVTATASWFRVAVATLNADGGYSQPNVKWVFVNGSGDTSTEVRVALVALIDANSSLETALGGTGRVNRDSPPKDPVYPSATYQIIGDLNPDLSKATYQELTLEFDLYATTQTKLGVVREILDEMLNELRFNTSSWAVRVKRRVSGAAIFPAGVQENAGEIFQMHLEWPVTAKAVGS